MSYVVCWGFFFGNNYTHLFKLSLLCDIMVESDLEDSATHPFKLEEWIAKGESFQFHPTTYTQGLAEYFHSLRLNFSRFFGRGHQDIVNAVKTFNKRKKSTQNDEIMDDELEGE